MSVRGVLYVILCFHAAFLLQPARVFPMCPIKKPDCKASCIGASRNETAQGISPATLAKTQ